MFVFHLRITHIESGRRYVDDKTPLDKFGEIDAINEVIDYLSFGMPKGSMVTMVGITPHDDVILIACPTSASNESEAQKLKEAVQFGCDTHPHKQHFQLRVISEEGTE